MRRNPEVEELDVLSVAKARMREEMEALRTERCKLRRRLSAGEVNFGGYLAGMEELRARARGES